MTTSQLNPGFVLKKGYKVRILRKESYWYNEIGTVAAIDKGKLADGMKAGPDVEDPNPIIKYPILVRFEKVNYSGTNSSSFSRSEIVVVD